MIRVHFPSDLEPLVFPTATGADISPQGFLRIYWAGMAEPDVQKGAVAPGWSYYTVEPNAPTPDPAPAPTPEPGSSDEPPVEADEPDQPAVDTSGDSPS